MPRKIIKVKDIKRNERIRFDMGDLKELAASIEKYGIIHPPVVDQDYNLIAGGRRLAAMDEVLGWEEVEVDVREDVDELTRRELELEENVQRKDLTWQEQVEAQKAIHDLKQEIYGPAVKGHESDGWGIKDTAELSDRSVGSVATDIKLAEAMEEHPELAEEKNKFHALKKLRQMEEEAILEELARRNEGPSSDRVELIHGDAVEELQKRKDATVELVIADPPWGIGIDTSSQLAKNYGVEYEDASTEALSLIEATCNELYRVMADGSHLFLFFGITNYYRTLQILEDAGFEVDPIPVIWDKGSGGAPAKGLAMPSAHETIFHTWKGRRYLNHGKDNVFRDIPRTSHTERVHTAQKPVELIKQMIELASDPGDTVLDPFGGSGTTAIAAALTGRKGIAIEKSDVNFGKMQEYVNTTLLAEGVVE